MEVTAIMSAIKVAYPSYYKNQTEIDDAINLWAEMLSEDDMTLIAKSVKQYIKTDSSGFPPSIGQIRTLAAEIRRAEWEHKQREIQSLPEPEIKREPMPDEIRDKLKNLFRMPEGTE
jgi:hypothetical protein